MKGLHSGARVAPLFPAPVSSRARNSESPQQQSCACWFHSTMAGIFARIFKQWFEQALVDKLADSKHFQKAAVATVNTAKAAQKAAEEAVKDPARVAEGASALWAALKTEALKDFKDLGVASEGPGGGGGGGGGGVPAPPPCPFQKMSVRELQAEAKARGVPTAGLLEKSEIIAALRDARGARQKEPELR